MKPSTLAVLALLLLATAIASAAAGDDLSAQTRLVMGSPDIALSGSYEFQTGPEVLEAILHDPIILLRLWEAYRFSPRYKAQPTKGKGIHVDDPTGISGDLYLVEGSGSRHVYLALGALNHRLVPPFRGKMAMALTTTPKAGAIVARIEVYVRMESRLLAFLTRPFFPIIRTVISRRLGFNAADAGTILNDLSLRPREAAARLGDDEGAALLAMLKQR